MNTGHNHRTLLISPHITSYLEVSVVGPRPPVREVAAYLAVVLHPQTVQLVQPIWNRFSVPPEREVLRIPQGLK